LADLIHAIYSLRHRFTINLKTLLREDGEVGFKTLCQFFDFEFQNIRKILQNQPKPPESENGDEIELFTEPAPCYAIFMHWPICSGREIMWGCIRKVFIERRFS